MKDGLNCAAISIHTRASCEADGEGPLSPGRGFLVEIERNDGEILRWALRDARAVAGLVKTLGFRFRTMTLCAANGENCNELMDIFHGVARVH